MAARWRPGHGGQIVAGRVRPTPTDVGSAPTVAARHPTAHARPRGRPRTCGTSSDTLRPMSERRPEIVFVDVDDTLVRSAGAKRIPMTAVVERVAALHRFGTTMYCWSTGGADYAREVSRELGLEHASSRSFRSRPSCWTTRRRASGAFAATFTPSTSTASIPDDARPPAATTNANDHVSRARRARGRASLRVGAW